MTLHYAYSDATVVERNTTLFVSVLNSTPDQPQSVEYRVAGTTAEAGRDFVAASGTITFSAGEESRRIPIQLLDDAETENLEEFYIELFNPIPETEITWPRITFKLRDDDTGYEIGLTPPVVENAGFIDIKIRRQGDFNFESSVEAYLEPATAKPGIDYVDQSSTITFPPGISERSFRVQLLNNAIEDGSRSFTVRLRNATGGVPIPSDHERQVYIQDNELGYRLFSPFGVQYPYTLSEGGPDRLYLVREGDYDFPSLAKVTVRTVEYPSQNAEAGTDFVPAVFELQFTPGQNQVEIPIQIINDQAIENREFFEIEFPTSLSTTNTLIELIELTDNEINPLPVTKICLDTDARTGNPLLPYFWLKGVHDGFLVRANSYPWIEPFMLLRLKNDGSIDPAFHPIQLIGNWTTGRLQVEETADHKYLVQTDRTLCRFLNNGDLDSTFQPFTTESEESLQFNFALAHGKIYISLAATGRKIIRLNEDGSADDTFSPPTFPADQGAQVSAPGPNGSIYIQGNFTFPEHPSITNYARLTSTGAIDPAFVPSGLDGEIFGRNNQLYIRSWANLINRVTPAGAIDPSFPALFTPDYTSETSFDAAGNFYIRQVDGLQTSIQRYTPDGVLDPTFFRGQTDIQSRMTKAVSLDGTTMLVLPEFRYPYTINGVDISCGASPIRYMFARLDLAAPPRVFTAPRLQMLERTSGPPDLISFKRTGHNANTTAIGRYKLRNGTAVKGRDFDFPDQGEINFAAGISRVDIPVTILDNSTVDPSRNFYIDLLNENGTVASTSEIQIIDDEVGIQILAINNNRVRFRPIIGEYGTDFDWMVSSDLINWETGYVTYDGSEVEIDLTAGQRFIRGARTTLPYSQSPWDSPIFIRP